MRFDSRKEGVYFSRCSIQRHAITRAGMPPLLPLLLILFFIVPLAAEAQRPKRQVPKRSLLTNEVLAEQDVYQFELGQGVNSIIRDSVQTNLYDPITIANLRRMKEEAGAQVNQDDIDPDLTRRVGEKALAIQSGRTLLNTIRNSDLRETYEAVKQSFESVRNSIRYSVQKEGGSYTVSKKRRGARLLELDVEFSPRRVLEPHLRIGDAVRFRYDYEERAPVLEYQVAF